MVETRTVVICGQCAAFWDPAAEAPACTDPAHEHHEYDSHLHRTPVAFADGTEVVAVSFGGADPYARAVVPDFGLYLDERWNPPWTHEHVDWPDFGVPADRAAVIATLSALLDRARSGQHVEVGCYGAHGRTGTALAAMAVLCGQDPDGVVEWVRIAYCDRAIETDDQAEFARTLLT